MPFARDEAKVNTQKTKAKMLKGLYRLDRYGEGFTYEVGPYIVQFVVASTPEEKPLGRYDWDGYLKENWAYGGSAENGGWDLTPDEAARQASEWLAFITQEENR